MESCLLQITSMLINSLSISFNKDEGNFVGFGGRKSGLSPREMKAKKNYLWQIYLHHIISYKHGEVSRSDRNHMRFRRELCAPICMI